MTITLPPEAEAPAAMVRDLVKKYGARSNVVYALNGISADFPREKFTAIMGPSGSGKSTLLHCLAGLDNPSSGRTFLGDTELSKLSDDRLSELRRLRIGFVFQSFNLLPTLTAAQNILLPLELAGRQPDRQWHKYLVDILGLGQRLNHRPAELSGGQQQRVAIARALLPKPDIVVADEPTGNLDSTSGTEVLHLLRTSVHDLGQTVIMVTHDANAASYADRVLLLADGQLKNVLENPTAHSIMASLTQVGR